MRTKECSSALEPVTHLSDSFGVFGGYCGGYRRNIGLRAGHELSSTFTYGFWIITH
jgi:hypothetical protein